MSYQRIFTLLTVPLINLFALNMEDAVQKALANSPSVQISQIQSGIAYEEYKKSYAAFLPNLSTAYSYQSGDRANVYGESEYATAYIEAKYNLFRGFADSYALKSAEESKVGAEYLLESTKKDIALNARSLFLEVLQNNEMLGIAIENEKRLESHLKDSKALYTAGIAPKNALLKVSAELSNAKSDTIKAKSRLDVALKKLSVLLGEPLRVEMLEKTDTPQEMRLEDLEARMFSNRSELHYLERIKDAAEYSKEEGKGAFMPSVDLSAKKYFYGTSAFKGRDYMYDDESVASITVSLNLFNGTSDYRNLEIKKLRLLQADAEILQYKDALKVELQNALGEYESAKGVLESTKEALRFAEENYATVHKRYLSQLESSTELLDAEQMLHAAKSNLANAKYALYQSNYTLQRVVEE